MRRSCDLLEAYRDLKYLLNRGYRKSYALRFVSDHYRLKLEERHLLSRCVFPDSWVKAVSEKKGYNGEPLGVDGFNVLITTESVIEGKAIACEDGLIRDLKYQKRYKVNERTPRVIELVMDALMELKPSEVVFFYGRAVPKSGIVAALTRKAMNEKKLKGDVKLVKSPDFHLKGFKAVATADAGIIEKAEAVVDVPLMISIKLGIRVQRLRDILGYL